ncbi:MAG: hypothetical protein HQ465_21420 [Rhodospirillales bacterium]|nr:hypothetical protein [Rhodospirillales bacterium]
MPVTPDGLRLDKAMVAQPPADWHVTGAVAFGPVATGLAIPATQRQGDDIAARQEPRRQRRVTRPFHLATLRAVRGRAVIDDDQRLARLARRPHHVGDQG